jgi:hypothetical protein
MFESQTVPTLSKTAVEITLTQLTSLVIRKYVKVKVMTSGPANELYYPDRHLEGLRKTTKTLVRILGSGCLPNK